MRWSLADHHPKQAELLLKQEEGGLLSDPLPSRIQHENVLRPFIEALIKEHVF
jgi:hypothetical protein